MPARPSDNSGLKRKMSTDRWWNDTDRGNSATSSGTKLTGTGLRLGTALQAESSGTETS
jgi:hypothetical protein